MVEGLGDTQKPMVETSKGDGTRKSDRDIREGRSPEGSGASNSLDWTGKEDKGLRMGTWVGTGSTDHRYMRFMSTPGSIVD